MRSTSFKVATIITAVMAAIPLLLLFTPWRDLGLVLFIPVIFTARRIHLAFHDDERKQQGTPPRRQAR